MRVGTRATLAAVSLSFVLVTAGPAMAAPGNGVHVDPGSPAGKQYAIPIPSARSETSGQNGAAGSANPPLFGVGVTPGGAAATGGASGVAAAGAGTTVGQGTKAGAAGPNSRRTAARGRRRHGSTAVPTPVRTAQHPSTQSNAVGGTSSLPLLGGGALVLLIGGGGGFLLRRNL
jgi:hypothetical protein